MKLTQDNNPTFGEPTIFNGILYRSKAEARWAYFFDELDIPFEYEKRFFNLGHGRCYLPDFWLPKQKIWVEIKNSDIVSGFEERE